MVAVMADADVLEPVMMSKSASEISSLGVEHPPISGSRA